MNLNKIQKVVSYKQDNLTFSKRAQRSVNWVGQHDWKKKPLYYVVGRGKMESTWEATMGLTGP